MVQGCSILGIPTLDCIGSGALVDETLPRVTCACTYLYICLVLVRNYEVHHNQVQSTWYISHSFNITLLLLVARRDIRGKNL